MGNSWKPALSVCGLSSALIVSGCQAQSPSSLNGADRLLTGREIHELQTSTTLETAQTVEIGSDRYAIPSAAYVRLAEVGRGTPSAYYEAWLNLRAVDAIADGADQVRSQSETVSVSVGFLGPPRPAVPVPDESWTRSEVGIPDLPGTDLWLDTRQCLDDQAPAPRADHYDIFVRAVWTVADTPLHLSCRVSLAPTPNNRRSLSCFGGSAQTPSGLNYGFSGSATLDGGCRATLEQIAASFAYLPLIVADWRKN